MPEFTPDEYDDAVFPELRGVKPPQHDPLFADTDNFLDEEAAYWKERETEREAWRKQWPNHCRACGGWGLVGHVSIDPQDPGPEPCEAMPEDRCHRCSGELETKRIRIEGDFPRWEQVMVCTVCHWSFDDGEPQ